MTEFETVIKDENHLLGCIFKLFLKYDAEKE